MALQKLCFRVIPTASRKMSSMPTNSNKPYTVIVEGNIGSGKTTFLQPFMKHKNLVEVCPEPVEKWQNLQGHNLLQKLYEDPKRWAFLFQTYIQLTMLQEHNKPCNAPVKIMERSLLSARYCFIENLFETGTMCESEYLVLSEWFNYLVSSPQLDFHVDRIIYLRTDPEVAYERIRKRNRTEENTIPFQLVKDLHQLHEDWLVHRTKITPKAPVTIIDANGDYKDLSPQYLKYQVEILQHGKTN